MEIIENVVESGAVCDFIERIGDGDFNHGVNTISQALLTWHELPELTHLEAKFICTTLRKVNDCNSRQEYAFIQDLNSEQQLLLKIGKAIKADLKNEIEFLGRSQELDNRAMQSH
jgi:hypothetical protein